MGRLKAAESESESGSSGSNSSYCSSMRGLYCTSLYKLSVNEERICTCAMCACVCVRARE